MTSAAVVSELVEVQYRWAGGRQGFVADAVPKSNPAHKATFIKGPLPLAWMHAAAVLPGKTLHVGLYLWYLAGLTKSMTVLLSGRVSELGVSREAKSEALGRLEAAGLVSVVRQAGRAPLVTLLAVEK
jgi:DNA-binding transcriptional ArsR family regulator